MAKQYEREYESLDGIESEEMTAIRSLAEAILHTSAARKRLSGTTTTAKLLDEAIKQSTQELRNVVYGWANRPRPDRPRDHNKFEPSVQTRYLMKQILNHIHDCRAQGVDLKSPSPACKHLEKLVNLLIEDVCRPSKW
jgi:hypothetical protein